MQLCDVVAERAMEAEKSTERLVRQEPTWPDSRFDGYKNIGYSAERLMQLRANVERVTWGRK
jgi:hypothetical protein